MNFVDYRRELIRNGYIERTTCVQKTYAYEWTGDDKRVVVVSAAEELYRNDQFEWYINNLINAYGYNNVLYIAFTKDSYNTRVNMPTVQFWIYNTRNGQVEVYDSQPNDFYGIKSYFEAPKGVSFEGIKTPYREKKHTSFMGRTKYNRFFNCNILLVAINIVVFIILEFMGNTDNAYFLYLHGGVSPNTVIMDNQYYRYLTSMFVHSGVRHIFNNMLLLFFIGDNLERALGHVKYLILYFGSGLIAGIVSQVYYYMCGNIYVVCVGASGAIFGVLGALIWVLIVNKGYLEELSLGRMILYVLLSIAMGINSAGVSVSAHVGGAIGGFLLAMILYRRSGTRYEN